MVPHAHSALRNVPHDPTVHRLKYVQERISGVGRAAFEMRKRQGAGSGLKRTFVHHQNPVAVVLVQRIRGIRLTRCKNYC